MTRWDYTKLGETKTGFYISGQHTVLIRRATGVPLDPVKYTPATEAELLDMRLDGLIRPCTMVIV